MATTIGATILVTLGVLMAGILFTLSGQMMRVLGGTLTSARTSVVEQVQTRFEVTNKTLTATTLEVALKNSGTATIGSIAQSVILLQVGGGAAGTHTLWVGYDPTGATPETWRIQGLAPDTLNPGMWDAQETLTVVVQLPALPPGESVQSMVFTSRSGATVRTYIP